MLPRTIAAAACALVAAAACAEAVARAVIHEDALVYEDSLDPGLGFELRPGAAGMKEGAFTRINADGLRERDIPKAKPAGEYRVVVVGDEPAFALGLPEAAGFVRRLEGLLRPPRGMRLVVINASMYHYQFGQEREFLKARALQWHPDLVVFEAALDQGPPLAKARYPFPRLKNFLRTHSVLLRWYMERSYWSRPRPAIPFHPKSIRDNLALVARILRRARVPGVVVLFPDPALRSLRDAEPVRQAYRTYAAACGLPFHDGVGDLRPPLKRYRLRPGLPWPNAAGEEAAARGMAEAIQRLIPATKQLQARPVPSV